MTETLTASPTALPAAPDLVRDALAESRQRWRHLVNLVADLAFETDAAGRFVFVIPEDALGWQAGSLIGQNSQLLVGDEDVGAVVNPFHPETEIHHQRVWLRSHSGGLCMMLISAAPLRNADGAVVGARGVGIDMTKLDKQTAQIADRLRRGQMLDHILSRVEQETGVDGMMDAALWTMIRALGAEGAAVINGATANAPAEILHECGPGASVVLRSVARLMGERMREGFQTINADGRQVLFVACHTRFGNNAGLALWRGLQGRSWEPDSTKLFVSAVRIIRMILDYEAVQREMAHQARTDPLTGLLNRRAFLEEIRRHTARLDRESEVGTLMFVDLDGFKSVNDQLGHATGDDVLVHIAAMLRKLVRPSDLVARLGGDEFAVWMSGADHMTAAERADQLCRTGPEEMQAKLSEEIPGLGISIGIATRKPGTVESIEEMMRRADLAMYEVKRTGRRHWRVSLLDRD